MATDVNTAILVHCNEEKVTDVGRLVQMIIWGQDELEAARSAYPKMINIGEAAFEKAA